MKQDVFLRAILIVSFAGIMFSGYLSFIELGGVDGRCNVLSEVAGLPTCVYGFFMYLIIFIAALVAINRTKK